MRIFSPFRAGMLYFARNRWRRPPEADLPPATVEQAFSLQGARFRSSQGVGGRPRLVQNNEG